MRDKQNAWGIQTMPEPGVRSSGDIGMSAASGAAKGAMAGSAFGPIGAAVGGGLGLATSLVGSFAGKEKEEKLKEQAKNYNRKAEALQERSLIDSTTMSMVAKKGAKANADVDAEVVEFEDNEVHGRLEKKNGKFKYVIKNVAPKGLKHPVDTGSDDRLLIPTEETDNKDASKKVRSKQPMVAGDHILNSQGKFEDTMKLIDDVNSQKPSAIRKMVKWIGSLPEGEETQVARKGKRC